MNTEHPKSAQTTVTLPEKLTSPWVESNSSLVRNAARTIKLDFTQTSTIDSAGISFVHALRNRCESMGGKLVLSNITDALLSLLQRWHFSPGKQDTGRSGRSLLVTIGDMTLAFTGECVTALSVLTEMIYWGTFGLLKKRDFRRGVLGEQMYQLGYNATTIVSLLSFLIGVVLSIQSAMQLKQFGADIFLVSMITWSMVRELGPLMTAIILAGRSGSATTAEIATMCVQEEVDALKTMGLNHIQFIVAPKFWAISLTMPVLTSLSICAGILGGFVVSIFYLDLTPVLFWSEMKKNIFLKDFIISMIKSVVFAWLIIWIGAYHGFKVRGGAEEVGKETTASVVTAIFIIIIADALFSFVYNIQFKF